MPQKDGRPSRRCTADFHFVQYRLPPYYPGGVDPAIAIGPNGNPWFPVNGGDSMGTVADGNLQMYQSAGGFESLADDIVTSSPPGVISFFGKTVGQAKTLVYDEIALTTPDGRTSSGAYFDKGLARVSAAAYDPQSQRVWASIDALSPRRRATIVAGTLDAIALKVQLSGNDHQVTALLAKGDGIYAFDSRRQHLSEIDRFSRAGKLERTTGVPNGVIATHLIVGPDGNLWFTDPHDNAIGTIAEGDRVTEYPLGDWRSEDPASLASGPDGQIWFTAPGSKSLGSVRPGGPAYLYRAKGESPWAIAATQGRRCGAMWFTEGGAVAELSFY